MALMSCRPYLHPGMFLLLLLTWLHVLGPVSPQDSSSPCPAPCTCREDHVAQVGRAYAVLCSNQRLGQIPDLSALVALNVSIMLKLDYCDLSNVTRGDLPPGLRLAVLHLNGNSGLRLAPDALYDVRNTLVLLDLQAVNLPFNDTLTFLSGCSHLQELSLSFNNKGHGHRLDVTAPLFKGLGLTSLIKLKLYNCNIRSLATHVFEGLEGLKDLHLGSNMIGQVPEALGRLSQLMVLDLSSNAVAHLPNGSFSNLSSLLELKLHRNDIEAIEDAAFAGLHASLSTLVMDFCSLQEVPTEAIRPLKNLTSLDLTGNLFTDIGPDAFVGSYCLSELYVSSRTMSYNKLMFTGQKFCIKDLKIRKAELTSVPLGPIKDLVKLQYLFLDKNNITRLGRDELKGITATSVSFSDNPIRAIEQGAFNGLRPKLILLLERTEVSDLGFVFDYPEDTFRFLSLYESPIPCDCTLKRILERRPDNFLYGTCSHAGKSINMKETKLIDILSEECRLPSDTSVVITNITHSTRDSTGALATTTDSVVRPYTVEPQVQRWEKDGKNTRKKNKKKAKTSKAASRTRAINGSQTVWGSWWLWCVSTLLMVLTLVAT